MTLIDSLTAPGHVLMALLRRAARGHRGALRGVLVHLPALLDAEERWLLGDLLRSARETERRRVLRAHLDEHERIRVMLDALARTRPGSPECGVIIAVLSSTLATHLRAEREALQVLATGGPAPSSRLARYMAETGDLAVRVAHALR